PQWVFGMPAYAFVNAELILCTYNEQGTWRLAVLDTAAGQLQPVPLPYTAFGTIRANHEQAVFVAGAPGEPAAVVRMSLESYRPEVLRRSTEWTPDPGYIAVPRAVEFPTENGQKAHAFYYPPHNQDFAAPAGERPPLLVCSHGGPTSAATSTFK